jgi:hypothetical protein
MEKATRRLWAKPMGPVGDLKTQETDGTYDFFLCFITNRMVKPVNISFDQV